ncbi:AMP-binding protein [Halalkalibacter urbisdiaboli]|uniref:AMP-binding protein n=1 Tax=Halalkalibacter urbisdiaboli TaxID=1960589 RepID=UPI000B43E928|nr:AMP-binding protein [Halalkalibacter urbisdiaboli]
MYIGQSLASHAVTQANKRAIMFNETVLTYEMLYKNVVDWKLRLYEKLNGGQEKRVALFLSNEPSFLELFFSIISLGWTAVPIDAKWTKKEREHALTLIKPDLVVCYEQDVQLFSKWQTVSVEHLKTQAVSDQEIELQVDETKLFYLGFTSGSTGLPKGFIRNHTSWLESFRCCEEVFSYTKEDTIYAPGPFVHSLSLFAAVHALHLGASVLVTNAFNAEKCAKLLQTGAIDVLYAVPTMLEAISSCIECEPRVKMVLSSGAKWDKHSLKKMKKCFPLTDLYEFYGASELSLVSYLDYQKTKNKAGSVGQAFPRIEIIIKDNNGEQLPPNERGQVFVKSSHVFCGYVDNPSETAKVLQGDMATVEDIGYVDEDGYLFLVGRKDNLIITGGLNVYPEEIEQQVKRLPEIEEAVIIGKKDAYWGEKLVLCVKWSGANKLDLKTITVFCKLYLSAYKCPKELIEVNTFPYTTSGKIDRKSLQLKMEVHSE